MSYKKQELSSGSEAQKAFPSADAQRPMTEYEKEQRALHKNLERLKAERLMKMMGKGKDLLIRLTPLQFGNSILLKYNHLMPVD